ncbi:hypothetical protein CK203_023756 [Vitis vinifera]|uniref:Uncharacterized protein n=1 Tax=Vitis vinifera TaxID=29760 RepID=A0A438JA74_VITVI|nr:hypothetical protein CK203_023756 [Vitis vinifera]
MVRSLTASPSGISAKAQNPKFVLHTALSSEQWTSKGDKKNLGDCLKEEARASQRKVGRGTVQRPMGLSNHTRVTTGNTSFALAYGMNAVIPTEIGLPTIQTNARVG